MDRRPFALAAHVQCGVRYFDRTWLHVNAAGSRRRSFLRSCSSRFLQPIHTVSSRFTLAGRAHFQFCHGSCRRSDDRTGDAFDAGKCRADIGRVRNSSRLCCRFHHRFCAQSHS
eukprot:5673506-Pleurochrysis_carterae.AAC.1